MRRFLSCAALMAVFCLAPRPDAAGATLDQLKGFSIEVDWSRNSVFGGVSHPIPISQTGKIKIYVGLNGHIFEYNDLEQWDGQRSYSSINTPDRATATTENNGRVVQHAWTMEGGNLQMITPLQEGFAVASIAVDPINMTCTFGHADQPDPRTGRVVTIHPQSGLPFVVISRAPGPTTCSVKRGNIFASDQ
jgi:hypothetical protein